MKTLKEIEARLAAIAQEVEQEGADLDALEVEARDLQAARADLMAKAEKRQSILSAVAGIAGTPVTPNAQTETRNWEDMPREDIIASAEYRSAFAKHFLKRTMNDAEKRAYTTVVGSAGPAIPTALADEILRKAKQHAPLLGEITLLHVPGGVTYAVEGKTAEAGEHTENADQEDANDTLVSVTLTQYEVTKYLLVSKSVERMTIADFEVFITDQLGEGLADKLVHRIISGSGSNQATGIDKIKWTEANSITVAHASATTAANVLDLIGLLPGGYDRNAKFLMSKKTLFKDLLPLQDKSKNDLVVLRDGVYYIQGYPVMLDDFVKLHEAYLGDLRKYVGNMAEEINISKDFLLKKNSYEYLGACMFDGKPALDEAFVKLVKASV